MQKEKKKSQIFRSPKNTGTESVRTEVFAIRLGPKAAAMVTQLDIAETNNNSHSKVAS